MSDYLRDGRAPIPEKEQTSRVMSANKAKDTKPELILRKALYEKGYRGYRLSDRTLPGRPDISFSKHKVAIFVHGCYWHRCPYCNLPLPKSNINFWREKFIRNIERDEEKIRLLEDRGWTVITVWECEIEKDIITVVDRIRRDF